MDRRGFLRRWRQVLRTCQLYPPGSPVRTEMAAAFADFLSGIEARSSGGVSLAFCEDGTWVEGEPTPEDEERGELGRQVYGLGVREIRFLPGADADEVLRFCDPLGRALQGLLNPVDEDLNVLLWEADLPHIVYFLFEEQVHPEEEREDATPESAGPVVSEYLESEIRLDGPELAPIDPPGAEERAALLSAMRHEEEVVLPGKVGRLLLQLLHQETDASVCREIGRALEQHCDSLVSRGLLAALLGLLPGLRPRGSAIGPVLETLADLEARFSAADLPLRAAQSRPRSDEDREALAFLITRAPAAAWPDLLAWREEEPSRLDSVAEAVLLRRLESDSEVQLACLRDARPEVRRLVLRTVVPTLDMVPSLQEILAAPDPEMRRLAAAALGRTGEDCVLPLLGPALCDSDERVRLAATEAISAQRSPRALQICLRILASADFRKRGDSEKRALYLATARSSPDDMRPFLVRIAERRGFFRPRRVGHEAELALDALARLGEETAALLEERWARKRPDLLRKLRILRPRVAEDEAEESAA